MKIRLITWPAVAALGLVGSAFGADMALTPPAGGSLVINSSAGTPALKVSPGRVVQLPGLPGAANFSSVVCHDANGTLGNCEPSSLSTPGPQGAIGPQGPVGPVGPTGAQGPTGSQGVTGSQGEVGALGPAGPSGSPGVQGPVGPAGPMGATGAQGSTGAQGVTGAQGATGVQGNTGSQGPIGPVGPAGSGIAGLTEARHGCFSAAGVVTRGTGFNVSVANTVYTVTYTTALGSDNYTLITDARANNGRSLAVGASSLTTTSSVLTLGWLDANETVTSVCFMAAR